MPRQDINTEFNTFVGGILTEANPINYPKGFTLDEENFILERNGTRRRRYGLQKQPDGDITTVWSTVTGSLVLTNVNYSVDDYYVVWAGTTLEIYGLETSYVVEDGYGVNIPTGNLERLHSTTTSHFIHDVVSVDSGLAVIYKDASYDTFHTTGSTDTIAVPGYEVYDLTLTSLSPVLFFNTRDFRGCVAKEVVDVNPVTLTDSHRYNLINNGWSAANIAQYFTDTATYPSLSQSMNTGLDAATGVFTSTWVDLSNNGQARYNGGRYVINDFARGFARGGVMVDDHGVSEANAKTAVEETPEYGGRIVSAVQWAGRLCSFGYRTLDTGAGTIAPVLLISKVIEEHEDLGSCFQTNDPTARDTNQLLDTDGLSLELPKIGTPVKMLLGPNGLLLFSTNGVYEVFSRDDVFKPSSLSVRKISDYIPYLNTWSPFVNTRSIVKTPENDVYFLAREGVIQLKYNAQYKSYTPDIITKGLIDTLYSETLSGLNAHTALAVYSTSTKTVRFLYHASKAGVVENNFGGRYDSELVYDTVLKAWYKNKYNSTIENIGAGISTAFGITDVFDFPTLPSTDLNYPVPTSLTYLVQTATGDPADYIAGPIGSASSFMHHTVGGFTDVNTYNDTQADVDNTAFLQTGYINAGDSQRYKQANYIIPSFLRTEDGFTDDGNGNLTPTNESSCMISAWWDYAEDSTDPKANDPFEAYRLNKLYIPEDASDTFDYGQSVITTKNRLTGRGRALSLRFESTAGKDCRLLGWGLGFETNNKV